jgi:3-oxoacyl-[acyl-carrier-protein] synthase III
MSAEPRHSSIAAIEYHLPERSITTDELASLFPAWSVEKIDTKTGIQARHISSEDECASDLAFSAVQKLFKSCGRTSEAIDFILLCTQSPDYLLPTTACLLQTRLGIPTSAGALDFSLGCSGYIYGLGLAEGLISSRQASSVLLLTADTYTKYVDPLDKTTRPIFGDGAAATLIEAVSCETAPIGPFVFGTDGRGAPHLILPNSGTRRTVESDRSSPATRSNRLYMNGREVFDFAIAEVPRSVDSLLQKAELELDDIDLFVFHQANKFILEELRKIIRIPREKFLVTISHCGNTVSSTIPIALKHAEWDGRLIPGSVIMLVGFGVGYSWGATLVRWR